jgi:hypothetical protein
VIRAAVEWWRLHRAAVALVGVVLALGLGLGLTAPATSPVSDGRVPAPGTAPASVRLP